MIYKFDHSSYATVWLSRDCRKWNFVAVKTIIAAAFDDCAGIDILRVLSSDSQEYSGRQFVSTLLDEFITEFNGRHPCIVTEVGGLNTRDFKAEVSS